MRLRALCSALFIADSGNNRVVAEAAYGAERRMLEFFHFVATCSHY